MADKVGQKISKRGGARPNSGGRRAGAGRKKGTPNKVTASVKEAMTLAFDGVGGVPALQKWASENRTEFYKLWAKLLPTQITGEGGAPIQMVQKIERVIVDAAD